MTNREMDKLVAEKIMGLEVYTDTFGPLTKIGKRIYLVSDYSTNMVAAWHVVEKMREQRRSVNLHYDPGWDKWLASFQPAAPSSLAKTAPMAICLAALQACDVGIDSSTKDAAMRRSVL